VGKRLGGNRGMVAKILSVFDQAIHEQPILVEIPMIKAELFDRPTNPIPS
jgi:hypothetical protein